MKLSTWIVLSAFTGILVVVVYDGFKLNSVIAGILFHVGAHLGRKYPNIK